MCLMRVIMKALMKVKILWALFLLLSFILTLPISWWGLAKVDFFYSTLHDSIRIDAHIQQYAPKNRFNKKGFEKTSKEERVVLFHGVVVAIHDEGNGLDSLSYSRPNNKNISDNKTLLFTDAEVTHLKDVANLLDNLKPVVLIVALVWLASIFWILLKRIRLPSAKQLLISSFAWLAVVGAILLAGPEKVFNQLHIWVFPKDHQWFFYYEESLMSTFMKAPELFGYISAIWFFISLLLTIILFKLMHLLQSLRRL